MLVRAAYAVCWSVLAAAGLMTCPIICLSSAQSVAASVTWPVFGPQRMLPSLEGLTDTVPDFVGPLDGSAELTIFTEGRQADRTSCGRGLGEGDTWPPPFDQARDNHAATSRFVAGVSRRSRHRTRPWSIRASGTAKVGTMTSG